MKKLKFIRWAGLIPFIIITVLFYVFTVYFMDIILERVFEKQATRTNGALVEIKSVNLSFLKSSLKIKQLQVTNPDNLMQNRFEVENIIFDFSFLPLLKKKFVTDEINVTGVKWLTKREKEGKIPDSWAKEWEADDNKESFLKPVVAEAFDKIKSDLKANLPDISVDSLKNKFDPRKAINLKELNSYKKAVEVKDKAQSSFKKWEGRTKSVINDQKKFISDTKAKINSLNAKNLKNPQDILNAINTVKTIKGDIDRQTNQATESLKSVSGEIKSLTSELNSASTLIKADTKSIVDKYSLGEFSISNFSKQIFGSDWLNKFKKYVSYSSKLRHLKDKYSAKAGDRKEVKRERLKGMNIAFPVTDNTPKFLIKKINLSAKTGEKQKDNEAYRGEYNLIANDISSNQKLYGKPATADFSLKTFDGPFERALAVLTLDYTGEADSESLRFDIKKFKLAGTTLGKGGAFPLPMNGGFADTTVKGGLTGEKANISARIDISSASYSFEKSSNYLLSLLQDIVKNIKSFMVEISFEGKLSDPGFKVKSTLDKAIADGIGAVFEKKLNEVRAKAEKYIREEVGSKIKEANGKINEFKNKIEAPLAENKKRVEDLKGQADKKIDELKKRQSGAVKGKIGGKTGGAKDKLKGLFGK